LSGTGGQIHIRHGSVPDAAPLAALAVRSFTDAFGAANNPQDLQLFLRQAYGVEQQTRELQDPMLTTLLAVRGPALLAFAQLRLDSAPPPCITQSNALELQRFYVDTPEHGRGVAQTLMHAVFAAARDLDARYLWLGVWERNVRGRAFYRKMGFTDVGSHFFTVGSDRQTDRVLLATLV
jgi:diamine N-acetyltransferase